MANNTTKEDRAGRLIGADGEFTPQQELAVNLRYYMQSKGISGAKLSALSGVPTTTISGYTSGKRYPRPDILRALANGLGVTVGELTGGDAAPETAQADKMIDIGIDVLEMWSALSDVDRQMVVQLIRHLHGSGKQSSDTES